MKLHYPLNPTTGVEDPTQLPWADGVPSTGQEGSFPPSAMCVEVMQELVNLILAAGITPASSDLNQAIRAIRSGQLDWDATDTGTANAVLCQIALPHTSVKPGLPFTFIKGPAANTGASPYVLTITDLQGNNAVSGQLLKATGANLAGGDHPGGALVMVRGDANGNFRTVSLLTISDVLGLLPTALPPLIPTLVAPYIRPRAQANLTLYVNGSAAPVTTSMGIAFGGGSDANNGLSPAAPFLTPQKAWAYLTTLDMAGFQATVIIADGTYTGPGLSCTGTIQGLSGQVQVVGNVTTPANVVINHTQQAVSGNNASALGGSVGAQVNFNGFKVQSTYQSGIISNNAGTNVSCQNIVFGVCGANHLSAQNLGFLFLNASTTYQITGSAQSHLSFSGGGQIFNNGLTAIALTGTPAFSSGFVSGSNGSCQLGYTYTGSATGPRYNLSDNAVLYMLGGAEASIPGNAAGTMLTGGRVDGGIGADWTGYTPTVTGSGGTVTATSSGYYRRVDKTVFFEISVSISAVSTPGTLLVSAPPFLPNIVAIAAGRENGSTGKSVNAVLTAGGGTFNVYMYDASSAAVAGYNVVFSGFYLIAA